MRGQNARFAIVVCVLAATAVFVHGRHRVEKIPDSRPLMFLPSSLGEWRGTDVEISDATKAVLGSGDFLARRYTKSQIPVDLFLAYFPTQRTGQTIHSPKNCLPGSGWTPIESTHITMTSPGGNPFPANRYVLSKGAQRELVVYWYQAHSREVASEYWAKFYMVVDAARLNRTDGALVRLSTPVAEGESVDDAERRVRSFADQLLPQLGPYIPA